MNRIVPMKQESSVTAANTAETMDKVIMPCDTSFLLWAQIYLFHSKGTKFPYV